MRGGYKQTVVGEDQAAQARRSASENGVRRSEEGEQWGGEDVKKMKNEEEDEGGWVGKRFPDPAHIHEGNGWIQVYLHSIYSVWQMADSAWGLGARGRWLVTNEGSMSDKGSEGKQEFVDHSG